MASPFTVVKGDEFTRLTPAGIIRCLQVQDPTFDNFFSIALSLANSPPTWGLRRIPIFFCVVSAVWAPHQADPTSGLLRHC